MDEEEDGRGASRNGWFVSAVMLGTDTGLVDL